MKKAQNEAAGAVNTDGQESELRSHPEYTVDGYLSSACVWCGAFGPVIPLHGQCQRCGAGVCRVHAVARDGILCPRCAVPQTAGELRSLYFSEPDPDQVERHEDEREWLEIGGRVMDEYDPLLRWP